MQIDNPIETPAAQRREGGTQRVERVDGNDIDRCVEVRGDCLVRGLSQERDFGLGVAPGYGPRYGPRKHDITK